jgi:phosphate-selective porin OprO/OprP
MYFPATFLLFLAASAVAAEDPAAPQPAPPPLAQAPAAAPAAPDPIAERLRKMEEMNQRLLNEYQGMSARLQDITKQNEALSRTVQDLTKRLDESTRPSANAAAAGAPDAVGGAGSAPAAGSGDSTSGIGGGFAIGAEPTRGPSTTPLRAYYDHQYSNRLGYVLSSRDDEFQIRFNGLVQTDARIYTQPEQVPVVSDINIPRMRMYFSGRMTKPIEYQVSLQRSTNSLDMLNAYINLHYDDRFQLRVGRFRAPYTYEWAKLSIWELLTPDRSPFALNFGPNRQIGVMGWGELFTDRLEYAAGIFDGPRNSFQDFNSHKDVMAFADYRPFVERKDSVLRYLSVGGSLDAGRQNNPPAPAILRSSTSASTNTLATGSGDSLISVPFLAFNPNVRERGDRALWELHATYYYKGLSVLAAWDSGHNDFSLISPNARPVHLPVSGYFVQAGYLLTGETLDRRRLIDPIHPFDLRAGKFGLGAFEIQARFSELAVGDQVFTGGLADRNLWTNRLDLLDLGFNWYWNKWVKIYFDWERCFFAQPVFFGPGPSFQKTNDLFWIRAQLYF